MTPRETWLLENLAPAVARSILERTGTDMDHAAVLDTFRAADPSRNASATEWLMRSYLASGFRLEDIQGGEGSKAWDTLSAFARHRRRLPPIDRSLNRYAGLSGLWMSVEPFERVRREADETALLASATGRELRRLERDKARRESVILREDAAAVVAIPLTEHAAKWWGRGSRWCTAADEENAFRHYLDSPLVVVTLAGGARIQLYAGERGLQAMDEQDVPLERADVLENWETVGPVLLWMNETWQVGVSLMPEESVTAEMWACEIERDPGSIRLVPPAFLTEAIVERAVGIDPRCIEHVPARLLSDDLILRILSTKARIFRRLPPDRMTDALWMSALEMDPSVLGHMPSRLVTREICEAAVRRDGMALRDVPPRLVTPELTALALETSPGAVCLVWDEAIGEATARRAMDSDPANMRHVPERFVTREDALRAVECRATMIRYVPGRILDEAFVLEAMGRNRDVPRELPEDLLTEAVFLAARMTGWAGRRLPERLETPAFVERLVALDPGALGIVPERFLTEDMCRRAVEKDWNLLRYVPLRHITPGMADLAVAQDARAIVHVPACVRALVSVAAPVPAPPRPGPSVRWKRDVLDGLEAAIARGVPSPQEKGTPLPTERMP